MRDTSEFPEEQPGAARTAGLHRLSRLTWRATQLSAVTAVGFATLFARDRPGPYGGQRHHGVRCEDVSPSPSPGPV